MTFNCNAEEDKEEEVELNGTRNVEFFKEPNECFFLPSFLFNPFPIALCAVTIVIVWSKGEKKKPLLFICNSKMNSKINGIHSTGW